MIPRASNDMPKAAFNKYYYFGAQLCMVLKLGQF